MMLFEFSLDLEEELTKLLGKCHIVIPTPIIRELVFLSKNGTSNKSMKAKASLKLVEKYDTADIDVKDADDSILELAKQTQGIVVTNDRELRKRLKEISIPVIFLRAKKKLILE